MKKIFIILLFCLFNIVLAQPLEVNNKIMSIPVPDGYGFQGFTMVDDTIVGFLISSDESQSKMIYYNIKSDTSGENNIDGVGHANDVTYNSKTGLIYVVHGNGTSIVHVFNKNFNYVEDIDVGLPIRSLTYVANDDLYLARTVSLGYVLDNNFKQQNVFIAGLSFSPTLAHQGWSYYDKKLFYANWSWIRKGGDGTSVIYIYGINGDKYEKLELNNKLGELEDVSFYNDKMVLGFESKEDTIDFYIEEIPKLNKIDEEIEEVKEEKNYNIFYFFIGFLIFFIIAYEIKKRF